MSVQIFLSDVSDEFCRYRDLLHSDLTRHNVEVKVQEDFKDLGSETLDELDVYIAHCDAVVRGAAIACRSCAAGDGAGGGSLTLDTRFDGRLFRPQAVVLRLAATSAHAP